MYMSGTLRKRLSTHSIQSSSMNDATYHGSEKEVLSTHGPEVARVTLSKTMDVEKTEYHRAGRNTSLPMVHRRGRSD